MIQPGLRGADGKGDDGSDTSLHRVGMLMHGINKEAHSAPNRTLIVIIYNIAARMQPEFYIPI